MPILPLILGGASILGKLFGGGAQGQAQERGNQNNQQSILNQQMLGQWGTQQNSLLQSLLAGDRGAMDRYNTQQAATSNANNNASQEATSRYGVQQGATSTALNNQSQENMQRAQLGLQAPSVRARQSVLGSLMENMQPVSVEAKGQVRGRVPVISGGLTPAALSANTRQQGAALSKQALEAQLTGSDVPAATNFMGGVLQAPAATDFKSGILQAPEAVDYTKSILAPPQLGGYRQPGRGESVMSWLSTILNGASAVAPMLGGSRTSGNGLPVDPYGGG